MDLKNRIMADLKTAMKQKDSAVVGTLRLILSSLKNREIDSKAALSSNDEIVILSSMAKQLKESIAIYETASRDDLVAKEVGQLTIIQGYLPEELSQSEIEDIIDTAIEHLQVNGMAAMGAVMKQIMPKVNGRADGKLVSTLVRTKLTS